MENIPYTKHEVFPGMILRISTCNEALDSQNGKEVDSETGVVTPKRPSCDRSLSMREHGGMVGVPGMFAVENNVNSF